MKRIEMYTKGYCPYCHMAKDLLTGKKLSFDEIAIDGNLKLRSEMIKRTGRKTVPQIFVGDQHIGGYDDLQALEQSGEFDTMLTAGQG